MIVLEKELDGGSIAATLTQHSRLMSRLQSHSLASIVVILLLRRKHQSLYPSSILVMVIGGWKNGLLTLSLCLVVSVCVCVCYSIRGDI